MSLLATKSSRVQGPLRAAIFFTVKSNKFVANWIATCNGLIQSLEWILIEKLFKLEMSTVHFRAGFSRLPVGGGEKRLATPRQAQAGLFLLSGTWLTYRWPPQFTAGRWQSLSIIAPVTIECRLSVIQCYRVLIHHSLLFIIASWFFSSLFSTIRWGGESFFFFFFFFFFSFPPCNSSWISLWAIYDWKTIK